MDVEKISREERKQLLRDWMTSQIQLSKVENPNRSSEDIAKLWRINGWTKMNKKWVEKALYGHVSKIPKNKGGNEK